MMKTICSPVLNKAAKAFEEIWNKVCSADITLKLSVAEFEHGEEYNISCGEDFVEITGERVRAVYYGIYHYFEEAYGVSYFWDGDVYPQKTDEFKRINLQTHPRFEYRGLRYFAHRGLFRFQAEYWSETDWERELDWLLKKRFNMFMLRIGNEDMFPLAFPDICDFEENDGGNPEKTGFDDRTPISTLKQRFETRKAVCQMAKERDLIQPVDCGTMTHWYSRTPKSFLEKENPSFLSQTTSVYSDKGGLVWDIREDKNLQNYFRLTEAYTQSLGCDGVFHTIGLAERLFSADRRENLELKKYTYRRICDFTDKIYPNSKLFIASWDFSFYWQNEEVKALLKELDPNKCVIFDYTSDTADEDTNFTKWGVVGEFPYVFGIFHGYQPSNGIRGDYELIERRMKIAAEDEYCKGFITWQELSHGDNFMLEYTAANAFAPNQTREAFLHTYCKKRFGELAADFENIYNVLYPVTEMFTWGGDKSNPQNNFFNDYTYNFINTSVTRTPVKGLLDEKYRCALEKQLADFEEVWGNLYGALDLIEELTEKLSTEMQKREWFDLARTAFSAHIHFAIIRAGLFLHRLASGENVGEETKNQFEGILQMQQYLSEILKTHPDYSLADTVEKLEQRYDINPYFRKVTLKENTVTEYCRTCISEVFENVTVEETKAVIAWIDRIISGETDGKAYDKILMDDIARIKQNYLQQEI